VIVHAGDPERMCQSLRKLVKGALIKRTHLPDEPLAVVKPHLGKVGDSLAVLEGAEGKVVESALWRSRQSWMASVSSATLVNVQRRMRFCGTTREADRAGKGHAA